MECLPCHRRNAYLLVYTRKRCTQLFYNSNAGVGVENEKNDGVRGLEAVFGGRNKPTNTTDEYYSTVMARIQTPSSSIIYMYYTPHRFFFFFFIADIS